MLMPEKCETVKTKLSFILCEQLGLQMKLLIVTFTWHVKNTCIFKFLVAVILVLLTITLKVAFVGSFIRMMSLPLVSWE